MTIFPTPSWYTKHRSQHLPPIFDRLGHPPMTRFRLLEAYPRRYEVLNPFLYLHLATRCRAVLSSPRQRGHLLLFCQPLVARWSDVQTLFCTLLLGGREIAASPETRRDQRSRRRRPCLLSVRRACTSAGGCKTATYGAARCCRRPCRVSLHQATTN